MDVSRDLLVGVGLGAIGTVVLWGVWQAATLLSDALPEKVERAPARAPSGRAAPRSVTLYQIYAPKGCPVSVSPFCAKVETLLRLMDIEYKVVDRAW
jgi:hypothetical protein